MTSNRSIFGIGFQGCSNLHLSKIHFQGCGVHIVPQGEEAMKGIAIEESRGDVHTAALKMNFAQMKIAAALETNSEY
jgi:hypothetical protein